MWVFGFRYPVKTYTRQGTGDQLAKLVVPRWFSRVQLGEYTYMNDAAEVHSFRSPQTVRIGKFGSIGACKFIIDGNHNTSFASTYPFREFGFSTQAPHNMPPQRPEGPCVGHDVWICDGAVIYGSVIIGNGAVVAGQAVVTKDVPPYTVVAGNPAKIVKHRFDEPTVQRFEAVKWWDLPADLIHTQLAPVMDDVEEFLRRAEDISASLLQVD